jgi:hypothetical protein
MIEQLQQSGVYPMEPHPAEGGRCLFERGPEQGRQQNRLALAQGLDLGGGGGSPLRPLDEESINPTWSCHVGTLP